MASIRENKIKQHDVRTAKLDLAKVRPQHYRAVTTPKTVELGPALYLSIDGKGSPESDAFQASVGAIYQIAYSLKFSEKRGGRDFKVAALEGLWWSDYDTSKLDNPSDLWNVPREEWCWRLLVMVPDFIDNSSLQKVKREIESKKGSGPYARVTLKELHEGKCVQILHVGPYATEPASIQKMRDLMAAQGLTSHGPHHEIYLSDPRRVAPEKLRTILRHAVR